MQTNQLKLVTDSATAVYGNDILYNVDNVHPRYAYDEIGNTTKDLVSGQDTIEWNLYNKVTYAVNNGNNSSLYFAYNGAGNRVYKRYDKEVNDLGRDSLITRTDYYVHDAQGNILAIYHGNEVATGSSHTTLAWRGSDFSLAEHEIYGSSRLGSKGYYPDQVGISNSVSGQSDTTLLWSPQPWYSLEYQDLIRADSTDVNGNELKTGNYARHIIGQKQYELTDHLGDVLATISDKRANDSLAGLHLLGAIDTVASWKPVVVSATDYYPFGMQMPGRSIADESTHCFYTSYTETIPYFTSITDTFVVSPPPYNAIGSATVYPTGSFLYVNIAAPGDGVAIHVNGLYVGVPQTMYLDIDACPLSSTFTISSGGMIASSSITSAIGPFTQALTFTPGADTACVSVTGSGTAFRLYSITLPRVDSFILRDAVALVCNEDQYHFGYNGQVKDNEWAGVGNHLDFKFRGYDARLGRFGSVDPLAKKYPWNSTYAFAENDVIRARELEGLEKYVVRQIRDANGYITKISISTAKDVTGNMINQKLVINGVDYKEKDVLVIDKFVDGTNKYKGTDKFSRIQNKVNENGASETHSIAGIQYGENNGIDDRHKANLTTTESDVSAYIIPFVVQGCGEEGRGRIAAMINGTNPSVPVDEFKYEGKKTKEKTDPHLTETGKSKEIQSTKKTGTEKINTIYYK